MTIAIAHPFTSAKSDGPDATRVQPSHWNAPHNITMATARVIGRLTADPGVAEELTAADLATLLAGYVMPAGTKQIFVQTAAPTGWTKDTTHNNKALRLVSGTASSGGSTPFTTVFGARTIAQANLPDVNLSVANLTGSVGTDITNGTSVGRNLDEDKRTVDGNGGASVVEDMSWNSAVLSLASGAVTFGGNVPLGGLGTAMDFAVQYVDAIVATKD